MIRKLFWISLSSIALFFFYTPAFAFIESFASGGMSTVFTSGASDAGRNPALMPLQKDPLYLVFGLSTAPYSSIDSRYHHNSFGSSTNVYTTLPSTSSEFISFSAPIGFSWTGERTGFGILLTSDSGELYSKTTIKSAGSFTDYSSLNGTVQNSLTATEYRPALKISWGIKTGDTSSFGIQFRGVFDYKTSESTTNTQMVSPTSTSSSSSDKNETTIINGNLLFGFHYEKDGIEAGAIISTPTFADYMNQLTSTDSTGSFSGKSGKFVTLSGPEIILGFSYPVINAVSFYFEFSSQMPMSYTIDDLSLDSVSTPHSIDKTSTQYQGKYFYATHAGIKYTRDKFRLIFGLSGHLEEAGSDVKIAGGDSSINSKIYSCTGTFGIEYDITEKTALGISGMGTFYKTTSSGNSPNSSVSTKLNIFQTDIIAGIQFKI